jgi:hypothetical protein
MYRSIDRAANPMCGKCDYSGVRQANLSSLSQLVIDKALSDGKKALSGRAMGMESCLGVLGS